VLFFASVSGGVRNFASGTDASVSGGFENNASGVAAIVSGGFTNTANGFFPSVSGGGDNTASGQYGSSLLPSTSHAAPSDKVSSRTSSKHVGLSFCWL
jgi:hypothetical protein